METTTIEEIISEVSIIITEEVGSIREVDTEEAITDIKTRKDGSSSNNHNSKSTLLIL